MNNRLFQNSKQETANQVSLAYSYYERFVHKSLLWL